MNDKYYLGIDTSNYKTSVALTDEDGNLLFQKSELLPVKNGERGLRQSDAFFQHSNRLPEYIKELSDNIDISNVSSIGVSSKPRRVEGSYMPCFLAGINAAKTLAAALGIPMHEFSHQEGHAAAVMHNIDTTVNEKCLFFHLSGGTTEFLLCSADEYGYSMTRVGGTRDISCGQLLDRIGVALGYDFPSGKYLDEIAITNTASASIIPRPNFKDAEFNLSGIETKVLRFIETNKDTENMNPVISELFDMIAGLLYNSAIYLSDKYDVTKVIIAGGVGSSLAIRDRILRCKPYSSLRGLTARNMDIIFGEPKLCGDNAIGISHLTRRITENK